jgi:hypothetical protein
VSVPHLAAAARAAAIGLVWTRPGGNLATAPTLRGPAVAERYEDLAQRLVRAGSTPIDAAK